jgi:hypothetical protein
MSETQERIKRRGIRCWLDFHDIVSDEVKVEFHPDIPDGWNIPGIAIVIRQFSCRRCNYVKSGWGRLWKSKRMKIQ